MREPRWNRLGWLVVIPLAMACVGMAGLSRASGPPKLQVMDEEAEDEELTFERELARRAYEENCLICHAHEMVSRLRLTPEQWVSEVEKMISWGAPVADEDKIRLGAYLAYLYPSVKPLEPAPRIPSVETMIRPSSPLNRDATDGDARRGGLLYAEHCATCHGPIGQGGDLGPNLVEKPVLLQREDYMEVLREGRHRMPGYKQVLTPELEIDILTWLQERRYDEPSL